MVEMESQDMVGEIMADWVPLWLAAGDPLL